VTHAVMPSVCLEFPIFALVILLKEAFPITDPGFDISIVLPWGTQQMEVVWHQEIGADEPMSGFFPSLMEKPLGNRCGKPTAPVLSDGGQENDASLMDIEKNARAGALSPLIRV
jgi:hypothetical protein